MRWRLSTCVLWVVLAGLLLGSRPVGAAIAIAPAYVELSLDGRRPSGQFVISNLGDVEERYRIAAVHFTFLLDGGLRRLEAKEGTLAHWIRFNPPEFILPPKTRQTVRFIVLPRERVEDGEYWGAIELESLKTTMGTGKDAAGREYAVEVIPSILVPVFAIKGTVRYEGHIERVAAARTAKGVTLETLLVNTGTGRLLIDASYDVSDADGKVVSSGSLGKAYVLRETKRRFKVLIKDDLPGGTYALKVRCASPQLKKPLTMTQQVEVAPPVPPEKRPEEEAVTKQPLADDRNSQEHRAAAAEPRPGWVCSSGRYHAGRDEWPPSAFRCSPGHFNREIRICSRSVRKTLQPI